MNVILGIVNPFLDNAAQVEPEFIEENGLRLDQVIVVEKRDWAQTWDKISSQEKHEGSLGGSGMNTMKTLARLGNQCIVHGMIGSDGDCYRWSKSLLGES